MPIRCLLFCGGNLTYFCNINKSYDVVSPFVWRITYMVRARLMLSHLGLVLLREFQLK